MLQICRTAVFDTMGKGFNLLYTSKRLPQDHETATYEISNLYNPVNL